MAYNGYSPYEFMNSGSEAERMERLAAFLKEDDTLRVWPNLSHRIFPHSKLGIAYTWLFVLSFS